MKNLTMFFPSESFSMVHMAKDVGMIPYLLDKMKNIDSTIVIYESSENKNLTNDRVRIVKLHKNIFRRSHILDSLFSNFTFYLIMNAKKIDTLMLFHLDNRNFLYNRLYKLLNRNGKVYLKLDINENRINEVAELKNNHRKFNYFVNQLKNINIVSIETKSNLDKFKQLTSLENIVYVPNGIDIPKSIKINSFEKKQNKILVVGRIGAPGKNHEIILEAMSQINLKNWMIEFIGPIEKDFANLVSLEYIHLVNSGKLVLSGEINDREKLYDKYNESKICISTSDMESFGFVLIEAAYFGNYIISTDTGVAREITADGSIGSLIPKNDAATLSRRLEEILENEEILLQNYLKVMQVCRHGFLWEVIIELIYGYLYKEKV